MKCRCEAQGNCSGKVQNKFGRVSISLCKYHGELFAKLQTMSLEQLEQLAKKAVFNNRKPVYVEDARRLALCSNTLDFHKHAEDVYMGVYDYTKH